MYNGRMTKKEKVMATVKKLRYPHYLTAHTPVVELTPGFICEDCRNKMICILTHECVGLDKLTELEIKELAVRKNIPINQIGRK